MRILFLLFSSLILSTSALAFDHSHAAWTTLLASHVKPTTDGHSTAVDYAGFSQEKTALKGYLSALSAVKQAEFDGWTIPQRRAFLINAYNAFTVDLILSKYPDLKSIKELGSFFRSPWKKAFFSLLGSERSLDDVEHGLLRGAQDFDDPRIHFAVNCASIGCPALRTEAFVAERLSAQLDEQAVAFLQDQSRNTVDSQAETLTLSPIFDWYSGDFEKGWQDTTTVSAFVAHYGQELGLSAAVQNALRDEQYDVEYSEYDWSLNRAP